MKHDPKLVQFCGEAVLRGLQVKMGPMTLCAIHLRLSRMVNDRLFVIDEMVSVSEIGCFVIDEMLDIIMNNMEAKLQHAIGKEAEHETPKAHP